MTEEVGTFGWREAWDKVAERFPECVDGSQCPGAQQRFEFGENLLDRVQVGAIGRQTLARPSCTSLRAWPISAEAKTSACSPFSMRSRIRPDGPNCVVTVTPCALPKMVAICAIASRRLPAP